MKSKTVKRLLSAALAGAAALGMMILGAPAAHAKASLQDTLNGVKLTPVSTGNSKYDAKLAAITGAGGTYDRVLRGYTWLAQNVAYDDDAPMDSTGNYWLDMAYGPLFANRGSCKNVSAATYYMLRYIGLPGVQRPVGFVINRSGRIQYHKWNTVALGGSVYLVDAQIEGSEYRRSGGISYKFFFKTLFNYGPTPIYLPIGVTSEAGGRLLEQSLDLLGDPANALYSAITSLF
ncbi:MAG: transglutaminase-like domain-containing protein [Firmicutes bacterium]|nr:transglutaminase-like domain-containing protein [Bacillota bacterium]